MAYDAEPTMGQAVSWSGQSDLGAVILLFLTRARCEAVDLTHRLEAVLRVKPDGQVVRVQTEFLQIPEAPAGRKEQALPADPQLATGEGNAEVSLRLDGNQEQVHAPSEV